MVNGLNIRSLVIAIQHNIYATLNKSYNQLLHEFTAEYFFERNLSFFKKVLAILNTAYAVVILTFK